MRKYLDYLNGFLVLLMFATIFIQIVARLIAKVPTAWSVETSIILFVFVVFLGIPSITRERNHLRVDALYNILPETAKRLLEIVCHIAYIAFFALFTYGAWRNVLDNWDVEIPTIEWFKWGYVYLFVCLASLLNIGCLGINLIEDIGGLGRKR